MRSFHYYYGSTISFCLLRGRNVLSTQKSQGELTSSLIDLQRAESEIMIRVIMNVGGLRIIRLTRGGYVQIRNCLFGKYKIGSAQGFFFLQKMPYSDCRIKVLCITFPILL